MSELPEGWAKASIADTGQYINGLAFKPTDWEESGTPIIRIRNLTDPTAPINRTSRVVPASVKVKTGTILVSWSATLDAFIWDREDAVLNQHIFKVVPDETVVGKSFLYFLLRSEIAAMRASEHLHGSTMKHINRGPFLAHKISLPPLAEQKRIADKLEAVLGRVNACRARLDRVPDLLKRFRQSVLAAATSGQLTEDWRQRNPNEVEAKSLAKAVRDCHEAAGGHKTGNAAAPTEDVHDLAPAMFPKGWELVSLRELVLPDRPVTYGILMPGPELEQGVPYVRVADFPNNVLNLKTIRKTSQKMDEQFRRSRLRAGDLLMSIRGTVGRLIVIPPELENANITQDTARLTIQPIVNREYVRWYLNSTMAQSRMAAATKGVAVRGINIGDVRALQVPLPSRKEQQEIVRRVEALFAFADRIEARLTEARAQVERLTPATLAKAFRGELVPQDPNDEPASKLLERIRSQPHLPAKRRGTRKGVSRVVGISELHMKNLIEVLASENEWILAQEAFRRCGIADGSETLELEKLYAELRELDRAGKIQIEVVRDSNGTKIADRIKLRTTA